MIKSLSPYYVYTPWVNPLGGAVLGESYTISIFVWNGLKASPPGTATYTKTQENPASLTDSDKVNIARLISDFIEFAPQKTTATSVIDGNNTWWVKTSVTYANDATVQQEAIDLFSLGYSFGNEGENITTITDNILLVTQDYKVDRSGVFVQPVLLDEAVTTSVTVKSFPDNEIDFALTLPATTDSAKLVSYVWVQLNETNTDTFIEVVFINQTVNKPTTTLLIQDECKYTPIDIAFQNKEGNQQIITFFKERKDSLTVSSESFESSRGQPSEGNHQFVRFNVQGKRKFTLNSGFIDEDMNEIYEELLLSERIWSYDGTDFTPLDIKTSSLEFKTRQKQKLINYSINFEPSYNQINNI